MTSLHRIILSFSLLVALMCCASTQAATVYVNRAATGANNGSSWADAYTDLSVAIKNAAAGDSLWVAQGTYYPAYANGDTATAAVINPDGTYVGATDSTACIKLGVAAGDISIYGGFSGTETALTQRNYRTNVTLISGEVGDPALKTDNLDCVVVLSTAGRTVTLDGITIQGGMRANGYGCKVINGAHLKLQNCRVTECHTALWSDTSSPQFTLTDTVVAGNIIGLYIESASSGSATLTRAVFSGNGGFGLDGNGHGVRVEADAILSVDQSIFCGGRYVSSSLVNNNTGGIRFKDSTGTITNSLIAGNLGMAGGAILQFFSTTGRDVNVKNCTFAYNATAGGYTGATSDDWGNKPKPTARSGSVLKTIRDLPALGGVTNMYNCILWGNQSGDVGSLEIDDGEMIGWGATETGQASVWDSIVEGGSAQFNGTKSNVTTTDPLFRGGPTGAWTANVSYDRLRGLCTLTHNGANFPPHAFKGMLLQPDTDTNTPNNRTFLLYHIHDNTADTIIVDGDVRHGDAGHDLTGKNYKIHDFRVGAGSSALNSGNNANANNTAAVDGGTRIIGAAVDLGPYETSGATFTVTDQSSASMLPSASACLLTITATGADVSGAQDAVNDLDAFTLLLEQSAGVPLTSAVANGIFDSITVYRDDGNGTYDAGVDTAVATLSPLSLTNGEQDVVLSANNAAEQFESDAPGVFHVVATLSATSHQQAAGAFRVVFLQSAVAASRPVVKSGADALPVRYGADTSSQTVTLASPPSTGGGGTVPTGDTQNPSIAFTAPVESGRYEATGTVVTLRGTASDNETLSQVRYSLSGATVGSGVASGLSSWTIDNLQLLLGETRVTVTAVDAWGNTATAYLTIVCTQAEELGIKILEPSGESVVTLTEPTLFVSGVSTGEQLVQVDYAFSGATTLAGTAVGVREWSVPALELSPGMTTVTVTVRTQGGETASASFVAMYESSYLLEPGVTILEPAGDEVVVETATPIVSGVAVGGLELQSVRYSLTGATVAEGDAAGTSSWSITGLELSPGASMLRVVATDVQGREGAALTTLIYRVEKQPLSILITAPQAGTPEGEAGTTATSLSVSGVVTLATDDAGEVIPLDRIRYILEGETTAQGTIEPGETWQVDLSGLNPGRTLLTVKAVDIAENTATATLPLLIAPPGNGVFSVTPRILSTKRVYQEGESVEAILSLQGVGKVHAYVFLFADWTFRFLDGSGTLGQPNRIVPLVENFLLEDAVTNIPVWSGPLPAEFTGKNLCWVFVVINAEAEVLTEESYVSSGSFFRIHPVTEQEEPSPDQQGDASVTE